MQFYAQTILQLSNQLQREGYSNTDLVCIRNAYELAVRLYTCRFQGSGKQFTSHGVGTASVLCSLHLPVELVAAGLIHNIYVNGDFGFLGTRGFSEAKRKKVRSAVGKDVENYIYRLWVLRSTVGIYAVIRDSLERLDLIDRHVVLIQLADQLDIYMDRGVLYYADVEKYRQRINHNGYIMEEIAEKLGFPSLAADLKEVFRETLKAEIPVELHSQSSRNESFIIMSKSYRRRIINCALLEPCQRHSPHAFSYPDKNPVPAAYPRGSKSAFQRKGEGDLSHMYAQTNIQLFNQLTREGYSRTDLGCILNAYELAVQLFTGLYRASGKSFIAHTVGTASILASLHAVPKLVAAGLIHAAYIHGDFGSWAKGISDAKREQVKRALGNEIEEYVARYATLKWISKTRIAICDGLNKLDPIDRDVVLMRLVNELEGHLDLGILYSPNAKKHQEFIQREGHIMVKLAGEYGFTSLAAELEEQFRETATAEIPEELPNQNSRKGVIFIEAKSHCRRLSVALYQELFRGINYLRRQLIHGLHRLRSAIGVRINIRS